MPFGRELCKHRQHSFIKNTCLTFRDRSLDSSKCFLKNYGEIETVLMSCMSGAYCASEGLPAVRSKADPY